MSQNIHSTLLTSDRLESSSYGLEASSSASVSAAARPGVSASDLYEAPLEHGRCNRWDVGTWTRGASDGSTRLTGSQTAHTQLVCDEWMLVCREAESLEQTASSLFCGGGAELRATLLGTPVQPDVLRPTFDPFPFVTAGFLLLPLKLQRFFVPLLRRCQVIFSLAEMSEMQISASISGDGDDLLLFRSPATR